MRVDDLGLEALETVRENPLLRRVGRRPNREDSRLTNPGPTDRLGSGDALAAASAGTPSGSSSLQDSSSPVQ